MSKHGEGGVGDGLAEDGLGVGAEGGLQLLIGAVRGPRRWQEMPIFAMVTEMRLKVPP
jgi:mono/diheme cytochrome c family protein